MDDLLSELFTFLENNPGASVIVSMIVLWRIGKDVIIPIIKGSNEASGKQLDISESLTSVITTQQTATNQKLGNIESSNATLVEQNAKTLQFYEKMSFAFDQQLTQTEKYLGTIGKGFVDVLTQHEEKTNERYKGVETFILQNTSELLAIKDAIFDMKMVMNMLALRLPMSPPAGEATEPIAPIRKTQPLIPVSEESTQ